MWASTVPAAQHDYNWGTSQRQQASLLLTCQSAGLRLASASHRRTVWTEYDCTRTTQRRATPLPSNCGMYVFSSYSYLTTNWHFNSSLTKNQYHWSSTTKFIFTNRVFSFLPGFCSAIAYVEPPTVAAVHPESGLCVTLGWVSNDRWATVAQKTEPLL